MFSKNNNKKVHFLTDQTFLIGLGFFIPPKLVFVIIISDSKYYTLDMHIKIIYQKHFFSFHVQLLAQTQGFDLKIKYKV